MFNLKQSRLKVKLSFKEYMLQVHVQSAKDYRVDIKNLKARIKELESA